ncbi:non-hydrolyzing UDP-N-acetylglucosamine 2-epimerase [Curtobacterium sp. L1-20]|uniref:non-hydrolyzing UDP-N-acetylglucosamine 2-epimerase n=1 Tax=Curtobacterium sp. L1-20 TaxID=3138181 RepID=UPI003B52A3BD
MSAGDIAVVLGTRPEIIKLAPVIRALGERAWVIHTGQHYDDELAGQYFREAGIGLPETVLDGIGGLSRGEQIGYGILGLTELFAVRRPRMVLVQGDTNTVAAAAQAAQYAGIPVGHVEAGLRSGDRGMPEEVNRILTGTLADVHFAPTETSANNLLREGVPRDQIAVTGNTVVEATIDGLRRAEPPSAKLFPSGVVPDQYAVATLHRPENTDTEPALRRVLEALAALPLPVVLLLHPRTRAAVDRFKLTALLARLVVLDSMPPAAFLGLVADAAVVVSDSGGLQEECTVLKVPLAVIRRSTERPEAIDAGFARLVLPSRDIVTEVSWLLTDRQLRERLARTPSPFGNGTASAHIASISRGIADGDDVPSAIRATQLIAATAA